jgi:hypothetical protein
MALSRTVSLPHAVGESNVSPAPAQTPLQRLDAAYQKKQDSARLEALDFWSEQFDLWRGAFDAAEDMDDWGSARIAFEAMMQDCWALLVVEDTHAPLRCPALDAEVYRG